MPKVPIAENNINTREVNNNPVQIGRLDQGINGGEVGQALQGFNNQMAKTSDFASSYAQNEMKLDSEKRISDAELGARAKLNEILISQDKTDDGKPKGLLNRELGHARGIAGEFNQLSDEIINKATSDLNPFEQEKLQQSLRNYHETLFNKVVSHEADQKDKDETLSFTNNQKSMIDGAALYSDDKHLTDDITIAKQRQTEFLSAKGNSPEVIAQKNKELADQLIHSNIIAKLEKDPSGALLTLEKNKDELSGEFYAKTKNIVEGKRFDDLRSNLFNQTFSKMKLADGNIDLARVEKNINESSFTNEQKIKLYDFAQARAGELKQQKKMRESSLDDAFHNNLTTFKKQGGDLESALKLAGKFGYDAYDVAQKEDAIKKLYNSPIVTNPNTYISLWEKTKDGISTKEEIDMAKTKGELSVSDWEQLRKEHYSFNIEGKTPKNLERVKLLADEEFGNNKENKNKFLYEMHQATKSMKPEEAFAYAKDSLSKQKDGTFFGFGKDYKWNLDLKKRDAENLAWGKLDNEIGSDEIKGIAKAHLLKGNDSYDVNTINDFFKSNGGYDAFKKGSPNNNAIKTLNKLNKPITEKNLKFILGKYPTGNIDG